MPPSQEYPIFASEHQSGACRRGKTRSGRRGWLLLVLLAGGGLAAPSSAATLDLSDAPRLTIPPPATTKDYSVVLKGVAAPGSLISVEGGSSLATAFSDPKTGEFEIEVFLEANAVNTLTIRAADLSGKQSPPETIAIVHVTLSPPAPVIDRVISPTNQAEEILSGRARPGTKVIAMGGAVQSESFSDNRSGSFRVVVRLLSNRLNVISIVSRDVAGNVSPAAVVNILHDNIAPGPPRVDPIPPSTREEVIAMRGFAEANARIVVDGGDHEASTKVASDGNFTVYVPLQRDVLTRKTNLLEVRCVDLAGNSSGAVRGFIVQIPLPREHAFEAKFGYHFYLDSAFFRRQSLSGSSLTSSALAGPSAEGEFSFSPFRMVNLSGAVGMYGSGTHFVSPSGRGYFQILTPYAVATPAFRFLTPRFDLTVGVGVGMYGVATSLSHPDANGGQGGTEQHFFWTPGVRPSGMLKYFFSPLVSVFAEENFATASIRGFNALGDSFDAGGSTTNVGAAWYF